MNNPKPKPKRVKAKITRTVTEIVICTLDRYGCVEEVEEFVEELDYEVIDVHAIQSVLSVHP